MLERAELRQPVAVPVPRPAGLAEQRDRGVELAAVLAEHRHRELDGAEGRPLLRRERLRLTGERFRLAEVPLEQDEAPRGLAQRRGAIAGCGGPADPFRLEDVGVRVRHRAALPAQERQHLEPEARRVGEAEVECPRRELVDTGRGPVAVGRPSLELDVEQVQRRCDPFLLGQVGGQLEAAQGERLGLAVGEDPQ